MLYIYPKGSINKFETLDLFSSIYIYIYIYIYMYVSHPPFYIYMLQTKLVMVLVLTDLCGFLYVHHLSTVV
jgi:hypothetical protein